MSKEGVDAAGDMAALGLEVAARQDARQLFTEHAATALVLLLLTSEVCLICC